MFAQQETVSKVIALSSTKTVPVWDLAIRLFHWILVLGVSAAAITGFLLPVNWLSVHVWAGSVIGGLLLLRVLWGLAGPTYARFSNFTLSPAAVLSHLREMWQAVVHRDGGHNALGAWMVVALLLVLGGIVVSGLAVLGGMFKQGPGKSLVDFATAGLLREVHEILTFGLLALVGLHVAGVVFESWRSGENLARSMVTGNKREGFIPARRKYKTQMGLVVVAALVGGLGIGYATLSLNARAPLGVTPTAMPELVRESCGECHMAFHPNLLPAKSWRSIMTNLDAHFGEVATLPDADAQEIAAYLVANSAETADTLPANRFRSVDAARPLEITATRFWLRMHGDIADAVFKGPKIRAKQNCAACHSDAVTGMFAPQNINIPTENNP